MSRAKSLVSIWGAACIVVAFMLISGFAAAADLSGAPRQLVWTPQVSSNPAKWTVLHGGITAGYGWGTLSEQEYDPHDNYGPVTTGPEGAFMEPDADGRIVEHAGANYTF